MTDQIDINFTCDSLMSWFLKSQRNLPWRSQRSVYGTLVSEYMLQQTQVKTALPYYERWMQRFPNIQSVAEAPLQEILTHWEGLGYYSRARHLHSLCQQLSLMETLPTQPGEWQQLKGIGPYTAAAITAIGQNYDVIAVDGNVIRVICRLFALTETFADKSQSERRVHGYSDRFLVPGKCGIINEALMELGAMICKPKSPTCDACPIKNQCVAHRRQMALNGIPSFRPKIYKKVALRRLFAIYQHNLLLHISQGNRLRHIAELPNAQQIPSINLDNKSSFFTGKRNIGLQNICEEIFQVEGETIAAILPEIARDGTLKWVGINDLDRIALSAPHRRWIGKILSTGDGMAIEP